jgi:L-alanine-DL-glutamate epimerase-like enolase superfamily enzyme
MHRRTPRISLELAVMSARIASVETFVVRYPITGQFKFFQSDQGKRTTRDTVVVKITDDEGSVGWGQSVPSPTWSYETPETVQTTIDRYLGPALIGFNALDADSIWDKMNRTIAGSFSTGQPICKAGIDLALHDLAGRILQQPISAPWLRTVRSPITLSWTIDVGRVAEVAQSLTAAKELSFHHFNVKVGNDGTLDLQVCRELRRMAPNAFIWVDANGGYDLETARGLAPQFADLGIAAFEQPFPANRLSWYASLRQQGALPVLMDEGIVSLTDLVEFHQLGLLDGVAVKVSRCGGLTEARRIVEYLQQHGLLFFASGLTDPDLALAASLILLGAYELDRPAALNAPQFLTGSIFKQPIEIHGDQATVPTGFGLGVTVDELALKKQLAC